MQKKTERERERERERAESKQRGGPNMFISCPARLGLLGLALVLNLALG